jgi:hypothetical protein
MMTAPPSSLIFIVLTVGFLATLTFGFTPIISTWKQRRITSTSTSLLSHDDDDVNVKVYDSAFSPLACEVIHALSVEHSLRANGDTSIFVRPPFNNGRPLTPLEHAIDSALTALDDHSSSSSSRTVEYWSRVEYMNIDAHVDIAEIELEDEGILRCPKVSHVLYLKVNKELRGSCPTCVFPGKQVGWDVDLDLKNLHNNDDDGKAAAESVVDLVTVPAVQGRILKFPGVAMHAVPCPSDRWLLTHTEEVVLRQEEELEEEEYNFAEFSEEEDEEEEEDDDDDDDDEEEIERSVLLFNTWPDETPPPRGAKEDYYATTTTDDDGIDSDNNCAVDAQMVTEWEEDYGVNAEWIRCNAFSEWREVTTLSQEEGSANERLKPPPQPLRVSLMGDEDRRVHPTKTAIMYVSEQKLRDALEQETEVTRLGLLVEEQLGHNALSNE